jgi:hypothetical protein
MSDKPKTLTPSDKHLLRLIEKGKKTNGWTSFSSAVWPVIVPLVRKFPELLEVNEVGTGAIARLTYEGSIVVKWL